MSSAGTGASECLNCGAHLAGPFCAQCGQRTGAPDPSFHDFLHELTHELLHVDGRLFQSIRLLFTKPGFLTREHLEGRRARYVAPMRLYLTFSVLFLVLASWAPLEMSSRMDPKRGRVLHTGGLDISGEALASRSDAELAEWIRRIEHEWIPRLMFVMVPAFAGLIMWATRRQGHHYPQHLYFALHVHAAWFGILAVAEAIALARLPLLAQIAWWVALAAVAAYATAAVRRVYGGGWGRAVWRSVWSLAVYAALLLVVTLTTFIALYYAEPAK